MDDPLIRQALALPAVPPGAVRAYRDGAEPLTEAVDRALSAREDVLELVGGNHLDVMRANHRNHHRFMSNVFRFGDFELLARTVPWVYRAYHAHGFSYAYFPVELRAWMEAVETHLPPAAEAALRPAYEWLLRSHDAMVRASETADGGGPAVRPERREAVGRLVESLVNGETWECVAQAEGAVRRRDDLPGFYVGTLQPALYEVGRRWEKGEISVAQEHLATGIAGRIMTTLYGHVARPSLPRPRRAVVTCAPNEYHEMGARMLADLLELEGWDVRYLGASTPEGDVLALLSSWLPHVFALSVCVPFNLEAAGDLIAAVRNTPVLQSTRVLVGGLAFTWSTDLWRRVGADGYAPDAATAVERVRGWFRDA